MGSERSKYKKVQDSIKIVSTVFKFTLFIALIIALPLYIFLFHRDLITQLSDFQTVESYFIQYKKIGAVIYIAAQVVQIIISIIPGQELQIVAGFLYGIPVAFLLSLAGAAIGTAITFYLAKLLGHDGVRLFFGDKRIDEYTQRINNKTGIKVIFLIYLIPGLPKDVVSYIAGLSDVKFKVFLAISLIGRSPGMLASIMVGKFLLRHNYTAIAIVAAIVLIALILGIVYREKIMTGFDKAYKKMISENEANIEKEHRKHEIKDKKREIKLRHFIDKKTKHKKNNNIDGD